jgi:hypothetical protein
VPSQPPLQAFTLKADGKRNRIITDLNISEAFSPAAPPTPLPKMVAAKGLWDTGATRSVISQ